MDFSNNESEDESEVDLDQLANSEVLEEESKDFEDSIEDVNTEDENLFSKIEDLEDIEDLELDFKKNK